MKWYEISEDDKYLTLILNSNFAKTVTINPNVTETSLKYLKEVTDAWDDRLLFSEGYKEENIDYSAYKARLITLEELEYVLENPAFTLDNFAVSKNYIDTYRPWITDNLGLGRWINSCFFI